MTEGFWKETDRLAALRATGLLDTPREAAFDDIAELAAASLGTPIALVSLVDAERQWFKAEIGLGRDETPLSSSVCRTALLEEDMLVVEDLAADARFADNPLVAAEGMRFYAGALVRAPDGLPLGTVCVLDRAPRPGGLAPRERLTLTMLARQVSTQIELRAAAEGRNRANDSAVAARSAELAAKRALEASEARLRAVFDAAPVGIVVAEAPGGRIVAGNARAEEIFGHPTLEAPDVAGHAAYGVIGEDGAPIDVARLPLVRVLRGEDRAELEARYRRGDGATTWIRLTAAPMHDAEGLLTGGVVTVLDIQGERDTQRRLRDVNAMLVEAVEQRTAERDQLWQATPDLLSIASMDGYFTEVNPAWSAVLGWSAEEIKAKPFSVLVHPDDIGRTEAAMSGLVRGEPVFGFENRYRCRDGRYRWFNWNAVPRGALVYAVVRDVTEQRRQAEALAAAEDALRQSQKMEAVGQLTGGLAHDFNNMLAGISGSLEVMQMRMAQGRLADVERYLVAAQGAARRAAALTHRLLAFSRRQTLDPKPTDANRLIADMEELVRRTVGPAIEVEAVKAGGLWATLVDQSQLENALLNLCINARDAMPDGGRIVIETANRWLDGRAAAERDVEPGQYVSVCVSDNGSGMAPDVIARAFDPFFTTKPIGQGTGLGLSMIYGFARQSAGQVRIYSEVGQGTNICLYLPRHGDAAEAAQEQAAISAPRTEGVGRAVLVVDDETTVRMLVREVLEEQGYATIEAADGAAALRILNSGARVDLLVTDVGLPGGMNGRQLADAVAVSRPDLRTLFITGYAENAALSHGHLGTGMHVLTKPFAVDALVARVGELLAD